MDLIDYIRLASKIRVYVRSTNHLWHQNKLMSQSESKFGWTGNKFYSYRNGQMEKKVGIYD